MGVSATINKTDTFVINKKTEYAGNPKDYIESETELETVDGKVTKVRKKLI